ncbi:conserved hypothetical integral membrane protein [Legionella busanensis]|uniref:Queuosine precursor transporter n=1 Tax=Legionella busanensis TaxID=190655 RepID=A0A378JMP7_9GAMM|nr:queuosine precursor transporter [Legionella busanensis]STX51583.1 conserved hypothetical integral membrane protein [Legionella busanensis]
MAYTFCLLLANWFDIRLIHLFSLDTDAGTLIFPFSFLLADLITEVYGYKHTRRAIWLAFLCNLIFIIYGQLVTHLPSPSYATNNNVFDDLMTLNTRIIFASFISYWLAEPTNIYILAKLKIRFQGRYMGGRFLLSTVIASGLDSVAFGYIAFYGLISQQNLLYLIGTMCFFKVAIECMGMPFSVYLAQKLKNYEKLDVYDIDTKFTLFSLKTNYLLSNNRG